MKKKLRQLAEVFSSLKRENLHRQVIIYFLIVFICGTAVYFFDLNEEQSLYKNIWDGIWWGFTTISTTGYGDKFPISTFGRLTGIFIMLSGMVVTVTISGTIASILVDRKLKEGQGLQKLNTTSHIVLCGWNNHGDKILEGFQTLANRTKQKIQVVLVNELPIEQLNEMQFSYATKNLSIEIVRGKFTQEQVLDKANISKAKSVIILADTSDEATAANADERTILAVYTVTNLNPAAHVSVEIINKQNEQHLKNTSVENIVVTGDFNSFLLAHSAINPGIPKAAKEIMNLNFGNMLTSEPFPNELIGKHFSDAFTHFKQKKNILLIGIVSVSKKLSIDSFLTDDPSSIDEFIKRKFAESERDYFADTGGKTQTILNPPWDYTIAHNDSALIIGEEKKGNMSDFDIFKKMEILNDIPEEQIKQLFDHCQRVQVEKGEIIMEEGEERYSMFFFLNGEVVISNTMTMKTTSHGGGFSEVEKSLVKLSAGAVSVLGEMSVIEELPRSATVKAFTECVLYEITKNDFEKFTAEYPEIGSKIIYSIAKILCHRVRRTNKDIVKLSTALSIAVSRPV